MTDLFQIRRACAQDGPSVLACLAAAFAPYRDQYTALAFADTVLDSASIQERIRDMCVLVAESGAQPSQGRIIGTIGCRAKGAEGHLRGMAVLPEWQGTAVASSLLEAAEAELRSTGCELVTLDTTRPLKRAIRFYGRHGFVSSERVTDFFGMELFEYKKRL